MNKHSFLLLFFTFLIFSLSAQTFFEGTISYSVEMKGPMAQMLKDNKPNDKMIMHVRGGDYIVLLSGGQYPKTFLFVADSNYEYSIDMANQRAFRYSKHADLSRKKTDFPAQATPTGKKMEIRGIMCDEYKMRRKDALFTFYVNDEYRMDLSLFPENSRAKANFLAEGLDGRIPLQTIKRQKDLIVITTATGVDAREFDPEQFKIPPGFTVKGRDYRW